MCESFCSCMISSRSCKSRASSPCPSGSAASVCWPCQLWLPMPSKWNYYIPGSALQNGSRKTHRKESMRSEPCWPKKTAQPQIWGDFLGASSLWLQPWDDSLFKTRTQTFQCLSRAYASVPAWKTHGKAQWCIVLHLIPGLWAKLQWIPGSRLINSWTSSDSGSKSLRERHQAPGASRASRASRAARASLPWGHHQSCAIILAALFTCPLYKGLRTERLCNRL